MYAHDEAKPHQSQGVNHQKNFNSGFLIGVNYLK